MKTALRELLSSLFDRGLGELLMLSISGDTTTLGQLTRDKGRLILKDRGFLKGRTLPQQVEPCWDIGVMGAVCHQSGREWESLTFVGTDFCVSNEDLSSSRMGMMKAARNQFDENLLDFCGSYYRGYQLMLDSHFLPVVLPHAVELKDGNTGLAVSNLRVAGVSMEALYAVHDHLQNVISPHLSLEAEDVFVDEDEFSSLFGKYQ